MVEPGLRWVQASWRFANRASIGGGPPARLQSSAATRSLWGLSGTRLGGRVRVARCTPRRRGRRRVDAPPNFRVAGSVATTAPAATVFRAMFSDLGRYDPCNRSGSRTPRSKGSPSPSPRRQTARASHREWRIAVGCMVRIVLPTSESADAAGDTHGARTAIAGKGIGP